MLTRHFWIGICAALGSVGAFAGGFVPDAYEDDDTPAEAGWIGIDNPAQLHNFDAAGDEDWLVFYIETPVALSIETFDLGVIADTFISLFASDGVTPLPGGTDDNSGGGGASQLLYSFQEVGFYYLRVTDAQGGFGDGSEYSVRVRLDVGNLNQATIAGIVFDGESKTPLGGAQIRLETLASGRVICSDAGVYTITVPSGAHSLVASAPGYISRTFAVSAAAGGVTQRNFPLSPLSALDINGDAQVDAVDVQLVINAVLGNSIAGNADVNGDFLINAVDVQLVINGALGV